jgi:uncharacterized protein YjbJ (UPF0337 family)
MSAKSDQVKGHVKEAAGVLSGDKDLESEGKKDRRTGEAEEKIDHAKDKVEGAIDSTNDQVEETASFGFSFDKAYTRVGRVFGITKKAAVASVTADVFAARFGPWRVRTLRSNIASVSLTGPYRFLRTAGPARLSMSDRGLTFASNGRRGVCLEFVEPITGMDPFGWLRHPNLTVTVADPDALAALLSGR